MSYHSRTSCSILKDLFSFELSVSIHKCHARVTQQLNRESVLGLLQGYSYRGEAGQSYGARYKYSRSSRKRLPWKFQKVVVIRTDHL